MLSRGCLQCRTPPLLLVLEIFYLLVCSFDFLLFLSWSLDRGRELFSCPFKPRKSKSMWGIIIHNWKIKFENLDYSHLRFSLPEEDMLHNYNRTWLSGSWSHRLYLIVRILWLYLWFYHYKLIVFCYGLLELTFCNVKALFSWYFINEIWQDSCSKEEEEENYEVFSQEKFPSYRLKKYWDKILPINDLNSYIL